MRNINKKISDNAQANHLLWIGRAIYKINNLFIMLQSNLNFRSAVLTAAIVLLTTASANAQIYWTGTQTLQAGQVINDNIILTGNTTITIASGYATINGSISEQNGSRSLTKAGAGMVVIAGSNNTYSGGTSITGGQLQIGNNGPTGNIPGNISVSNNMNLVFCRSNDYTYSGVISGAGNVFKWAAGRTTLTGTNTYSGYTRVDDGILQIGNGTTGSIQGTSNVQMLGGALRFEPGITTNFSKVISGTAGSLQFKGQDSNNKILELTAANTFTGPTTIEQGRLVLAGATATLPGNIINNGDLVISRSNAYTYSGVISGTGILWKAGAGTLTLNGNNTYTGATWIYEGTLTLGTNGNIAASSGVYLHQYTCKLNIAAGSPKTVKGLNSEDSTAEVILGSSLTIDGGGNFRGLISGSGSLFKSGTGTLYINNFTANTYSGGTQINSGTVEFLAVNSFGTAHINIAGGTLRWRGTAGIDISSRIGWINGAVTFDTYGINVTFDTALPTTTHTITKAGGGILTLAQNQTYTGATVVTGGTLRFQGNLATSGITISSGANVTFNRTSGNTTYSGVISGAGSVTQNGGTSQVLILTGNNTYTGNTSVTGGHLYVGNSTTTGSIAGNISLSSGRIMRLYRSNEYTYSGVISGAGNVEKWGAGKTTLTGVNTYTGITQVHEGTLQIGNGTSGSIQGTSNVVLYGGVFRFEPGDNIAFSKVISGTAGSVQFKGQDSNNKQLFLTAANTYTGTTTIEQGRLNIGNGDNVATIAGNIINNGDLVFRRANAYTYPGIISGTGDVWVSNGGSYTFNTAHTYTGATNIHDGTIILGTSGTIANSSGVMFNLANSKLSISGNKTIKGLHSYNNTILSTVVDLGANTLTIGTAGVADGGGTYAGKFTGTGNVTKTGTATLTLNNSENTATGMFTHSQGTVNLSGTWKGNYNKAAGATLTVTGNPIIEGTFMISGGNINMDLTQTVPSKITVFGNVSASGVNTLNISSGAQTNYALIQAAGGLTTITPFSLNMPGFDASLTATGTTLLLTATVSDTTPPIPGEGVLVAGVTAETIELIWYAATDNLTPQANLRYFVYQSSSNNINTVANCEANGTLLNTGGSLAITSYIVPDLSPNTTYYFNVVVADQANNKAAYTTKSVTTNKAELTGTVTISGDAIFGETLTAITTELTSNPEISDLGALSYQWKRGTLVVGYLATYTLVVGDIGQTITVTVSAANCDGSVTSAPTEIVSDVSINDMQLNKFTIYPNPTHGQFSIVGTNNIRTNENGTHPIEIFDTAGRKMSFMSSESLQNGEISIDISHLPNGIYFVKIGNETIKIVKR
ncbi:MAG: autotransporter-associated beta strand repeat-containing protein [Marinilabiliaceae bacterium]|nr:autotransporter-associated beta strand repeat-containing protein [Marinilabiliaceae bacterium]